MLGEPNWEAAQDYGRAGAKGAPVGRNGILVWKASDVSVENLTVCTLLVSLAPDYSGQYREPFLGSGAVFFELAPSSAVLSDANGELVRCFEAVAEDPHAIMRLLDHMPNTPEYFERMRRQEPDSLPLEERAARVIY